MSTPNPFQMLEVDAEPQQKKVAPKAAPKAAAKAAAPKAAAPKAAAAAAPAAPKKDAKAAPKKPLGDRHTKGGRDAGEANTKRPHDRSLNRQQDKKVERKGEKTGVKGSWGNKDPKADQVAADVEQKKDEAAAQAEAKVEEAPVVEEKKPEEPAPFLLKDALKQRKKVAGENTKVRAADTSAAETAVVNSGAKPNQEVAFIRKTKSSIDAKKKTLSMDEFIAVSGGKARATAEPEQQRKKKAAFFPAL